MSHVSFNWTGRNTPMAELESVGKIPDPGKPRLKQKCRQRRLMMAVAGSVVVAIIVVVVLVVVMGGSGSAAFIKLDDLEKEKFGDVLLMRHATAPGGGDPPGFVLKNCSTQRNLDSSGVSMAREVGEKLANSTITISTKVYSSQWCRCLDTAAQIVTQLNNNFPHAQVDESNSQNGNDYTVVEEWGLNSFYQPDRGGFTKDACMKRLNENILGKLKAFPVKERGGALTLMVTHQVTVSAISGLRAASGEIIVYDSRSGEAKRLKI